jgi:hypothetical protein
MDVADTASFCTVFVAMAVVFGRAIPSFAKRRKTGNADRIVHATVQVLGFLLRGVVDLADTDHRRSAMHATALLRAAAACAVAWQDWPGRVDAELFPEQDEPTQHDSSHQSQQAAFHDDIFLSRRSTRLLKAAKNP